MSTDQTIGQPQATATQVPATQIARMQAAIARAVAVGPGFLAGKVDAEHMAHTMVGAVRGYVQQERALGSDGSPKDPQAKGLYNVLGELMACGSGFLAQRCDAACVARTMTQMVREFGGH